MSELKKKILEIGEKTARKLWEEETDRDIVGAGEIVDLEHDGEKYKLTIDAFWEKDNYFDYILEGVGFDYKEEKLVAGYF